MVRDDYAYWLTVNGTPEEQKTVFDLLNEKAVIGEFLEPDGPEDAPYSHYCYPQEHGCGPEWYKDDMDNTLHEIALRVPNAILELDAENIDHDSVAFTKRFHADLYQEVYQVTMLPPLVDGADIPFDKRNDRTANEPHIQKKRAMTLYDQMLGAFNESNEAFYVAQNLSYLARCVDTDEKIPLDTLYQLAQRLNDANATTFCQPFLNEERLDAVRALLENGMDHYGIGDYLTREETLNFLLSCGDEAFAYVIEEVAAYNQNLYAPETTNDLGEEALREDLDKFQQTPTKPTLDSIISSAEDRKSRGGEEGAPHREAPDQTLSL